MSDSALDEQAERILRTNDRGGYTVPTARLYPHQWNWDSAFSALGWATFERTRAWEELFKLFEGQWPDGMVPHIIFRSNDPNYFPGPDVWATAMQPPTSGHSQPPVAATVVMKLMRNGAAADKDQARQLYPKLLKWHRWFHSAREAGDQSAACVMHPWESGRDNCPDWDKPMDAMRVDPDLGPYRRRDTEHVNPEERPSTAQYDRYLTIVKFGRDCGWDSKKIAREGPFFVADPGVHFILLKADRDLLGLAHEFGNEAELQEIEGWIARAEKGTDWLWNEEISAFAARDVRSGAFSPAASNASFLAFYAGAGSTVQKERLLEELQRIVARVRFAAPSWDPDDKGFEHKRYWRGPVWLMMNAMIAEGLYEAGALELARRVRGDTLELIRQSGFFEYYSPLTGEGLGGGDFSWTAAIWLALRRGFSASEASSTV